MELIGSVQPPESVGSRIGGVWVTAHHAGQILPIERELLQRSMTKRIGSCGIMNLMSSLRLSWQPMQTGACAKGQSTYSFSRYRKAPLELAESGISKRMTSAGRIGSSALCAELRVRS